MDKTYTIIETLCKEKGITINKLCTDIRISNGILFDLKSGRTKKLSTQNLHKISQYFKVPIDFLLDLGEIDQSDIPPEPELSDRQLIVAFWGKNPKNMDKDDLDRLRSFAKYLEQEKGD